MSYAFVFYGQPRTWRRCLPEVLSQLDQLRTRTGVDVHLFCSTKDYNSWTNSPKDESFSGEVSVCGLLEMYGMMKAFDPGVRFFVDQKSTEDSVAKNSWHYTSTFRSLQLSHHELIKSSFKIGSIFWGRLDVLYKGLENFEYPEPGNVYTRSPSIRYENENYSLGIQDYYVYGDALTMSLMLSGTYSCTIDRRHPMAPRFSNRGPGVYLKSIADQSQLRCVASGLELAIVRPSADQDPKMGFDYHAEYWKSNHTGIQNYELAKGQDPH